MPYCAHSSTFKIPFHQAASRVTGKVKLSEIHIDGRGANRDLLRFACTSAPKLEYRLRFPAGRYYLRPYRITRRVGLS